MEETHTDFFEVVVIKYFSCVEFLCFLP